MKKWIAFGVVASILNSILQVGFFAIMGSDWFSPLVILAFLCVPLFIKEEKKNEIGNYRFFSYTNIEILLAVTVFVIACADDLSYCLYDIDDISIYCQPLIRAFLRCFAQGIVLWYFSFAFDFVIRMDNKREFWTRSFVYRIIKFIKQKNADYLDEVSHTDLSKDLDETIKKFVIINAIIMTLCAAVWFFGIIGIVIYGFVLSRNLYRFFAKQQQQYKALLEITRQMAEGKLDVDMPADLGVYESFRENVEKIQDGIKEAVTKEVASERMRMELVSNVSHDLKTPLTAMITYIDLCKDENLSPEKRKEYLNILANRSDRLKQLIEDLFEVTKATTGNTKFEPMEVDLVNLVKQVAFEYEYRFKDAGLELVYDLPNEKVPIFVDSQKSYRIYANLFGNVAKYSLKNSRVYIQISETETQAMVVIRNISAQRITQKETELVERFVRGDKSRNTEGSGLGLAIAKSFTELQGGSFDIIVDGDLFKAVTVWKKVIK